MMVMVVMIDDSSCNMLIFLTDVDSSLLVVDISWRKRDYDSFCTQEDDNDRIVVVFSFPVIISRSYYQSKLDGEL